MANYDFMPSLMNSYQNRTSADQQKLTPETPYILNPNNPEQYIPDPNAPTGPQTWADITKNYNPNGMFNQQMLDQFNSIANNPAYTSLYGPAPTSGNPQDIQDWMTLVKAGGGMYAGTQQSAFDSFMGDYGFLLPMGAAAAAAMATGGLGSMLGAGATSGAESAAGVGGAMDMGGSAGIFDSFGNPLYQGISGAASTGANPWGLSGLEGGGGSYANGVPMAEGGAANAGSAGGSLLDTIKSAYSSLPPGTSNLVKAGINAMTQDPNNGSGIDWGRLGGGLLGYYLNQSNLKDATSGMQKVMDSINQNQFPFRNYQQQVQDYMQDPAKRMQMLKSTPGYLESSAYADNAQHRINGRFGDLSGGYGDALRMDAIGKNAQAWDSQLFGQLEKASGMDFNNANAQAYAAANMFPWIYGAKSGNNLDLGTTIQKSGILGPLLQAIGLGGRDPGMTNPLPGPDAPGNTPDPYGGDWGNIPDDYWTGGSGGGGGSTDPLFGDDGYWEDFMDGIEF